MMSGQYSLTSGNRGEPIFKKVAYFRAFQGSYIQTIEQPFPLLIVILSIKTRIDLPKTTCSSNSLTQISSLVNPTLPITITAKVGFIREISKQGGSGGIIPLEPAGSGSNPLHNS